MAIFKIRKSGEAPTSASNAPQSLEGIRLRAVFRLIGSAVLVAAAIVGFPLVFDSQPRPIAVDVLIDIPDKSKVSPLVVAKSGTSVPSTTSLALEENLPPLEVKSTPVAPPVPAAAAVEPKIGIPAESKSQSASEPKMEAKTAAKSLAKPDDGAKVLALLIINYDLPIELIVEIDVGNRIRRISSEYDTGRQQQSYDDGCDETASDHDVGGSLSNRCFERQ